MKIGRNDPCPCGSGKKYKHCCLRKELTPLSQSSASVFDNLKAEFTVYDNYDLNTSLAGLQLWPENHSHTIRLEFASKVACSIKHGGKKKISGKQLQEILNKYMSADGPIGEQEDPTENVFTENIVFHGGNYVVYPGIYEGGSFVLRKLLMTIFQFSDSLPSEFVETTKGIAICLLTLSNEIANRMGHLRHMDSPDKSPKEIQVPDSDQLFKSCEAVKFPKLELDTILEQKGFNSTYLSPFISQIGDKNFLVRNSFQNPLLTQPLVEIDDVIVVVLPASILDALRHFIWVISHKYGIRELLAEKFRETLWIDINECFRLMSFEHTDIELPPLDTDLPLKEGIYRIDTDKFAYIQLVVDDAKDYPEKEPNSIWELGTLPEKMDARSASIVELLKSKTNNSCCEILLIVVLEGIGRYCFLTLKKLPPNTRCLQMTAENLEIITQLRECDNLTLWKYAGAKAKLQKRTRVTEFSFLDSYTLYLDRKHSFYVSDEKLPNLMLMTPGSGRKLRTKAMRITDHHAALRGDPPCYVTVCRRHKDESNPIYFPEGAIGRSFEQLVEGYAPPIWVKPEQDSSDIPNELIKTYFEATEMFTYWLWQLTPSLEKHLAALGQLPIHICFCFENPNKWHSLHEPVTEETKTDPNFVTQINKRDIRFELPDSIQAYLLSANNQGERLILDALMESFGEMLIHFGHNNSLGVTERTRILDIHAPLGRKKKFYAISTEWNASLNPRYLPRLRLIQDHDIEEQLDGLVEELGDKAPPVGYVTNKKDRTDLLGKIVDIYYKRLKSILSNFSWQSVIEYLISYNETIWNHRATVKLNIPLRLQCFTNHQTEVVILAEEIPKIDSTALSLRTLIEIVAAEPPTGHQELNKDTLDKLIAITYHLIHWALISDQIHLNIFDHKIGILPSGRLGLEKEKIEGIWDPFIVSKTQERIEHAINSFQNYFETKNHALNTNPDDVNYESISEAEFGLPMTQIVAFHKVLTIMGFEQSTPSPNLRLSELKSKLKEILKWKDTEIELAVELFSLSPREKWEKAPPGFTAKDDIWPWRYNRRLSYLRKPLIVGPEPKKDPKIFWGPRHAEKACNELLDLVLGGRYKPHKKSSREMITLMRKIQGEIGGIFVKEVEKWFNDNTDWLVKPKVPINPKAALRSEDDLGDIDILAIDQNGNRIFSIECKNIHYGRNPREVANEIVNFIGKDDNTDSWIDVHIKRDSWLKNNIGTLSTIYSLKQRSFKVFSFILTSEEIPATYIRTMALLCVSFSRLKREGIKILNNL